MAEYIEREALYRKIAELETLARDRYLDTPTNSPVYPRYMAQLGERTQLKFLVMDFPAADVVEVVRCFECVFCREVQGIGREHHWKICKLLCADVQDDGFCYWGERRADNAAD